jgi:hypothetical protein
LFTPVLLASTGRLAEIPVKTPFSAILHNTIVLSSAGTLKIDIITGGIISRDNKKAAGAFAPAAGLSQT